MSVDEVLRRLGTSSRGLSSAEARTRLAKYGPNRIIERRRRSDLELFLEQFKSFLIGILLVAVVISAAFGEIVDAAVIAAIVLLNAVLGFVQTKKAEEALAALKRMTVPTVKVVRDWAVRTVPAHILVPGDIIYLNVGDRVPADCRLISQMNLKTDESLLTGESIPVVKDERELKADAAVPNRTNMLFSGTTVVYGHGIAVAALTGMATEFGKIAETVQAPEEETPLQRKLDDFGKMIGAIFIAACAAIFLIGALRGTALFEMFLTALALAVAAVPEGLLAAITIALAAGVSRMARRGAIIKRLTAVESLGSVTVICSDKTGTLTVNEMTVKRIWTAGREIEVTGEGYGLEGKFLSGGEEISVSGEKDVALAITAGMLCNDAIIDHEVIGDPTEAALLVVGTKAGITDPRKGRKRIDEIPFDSKRKMMSVMYDVAGRTVFVKGAVEELLDRCATVLVDGKARRMTPGHKKRILDANKRYAAGAYRVIAVAMKRIRKGEGISESGLMFLGLHAMHDPPRPEAIEAVKACRGAGIRVVMITGDHRETAVAIAKELDILRDGIVLTGDELDRLSGKEFERIAEKVTVYARVSPEHKVRITDALRKRGNIVAMTGDGVNDAPALKKSDVGVAMGVTGTDVTKEVGDVVITDDNFATIVAAVKEGRGIYDNIRKTIAFLLSGNISEILIVFAAIALGLPLPLIAIQILWINLVTDGLPALALAVDPIEKDIMRRKPRQEKEGITAGMEGYIAYFPAIMTLATVAMFATMLDSGAGAAVAQTAVFTSIVVFEIFAAFSCRSLERSVGIDAFGNRYLIAAAAVALALHLAILYMPHLNSIFNTAPLGLAEWAWILAMAAAGFAFLELYKNIKGRKIERQGRRERED